MRHRYDIRNFLEAAIGYRGLPFPGMFYRRDGGGGYLADDFIATAEHYEPMTHSNTGAVVRRQDVLGGWYFMPVAFETQRWSMEAENAVVSIVAKKSIVSTPLVGLEGTVKELISIDDYEISIAGVILSGDWPEAGITQLHELFRVNEAVGLKCAMTDIFLSGDDKVVITDISYPEMQGVENAQAFKMKCLSDKPFELIIT